MTRLRSVVICSLAIGFGMVTSGAATAQTPPPDAPPAETPPPPPPPPPPPAAEVPPPPPPAPMAVPAPVVEPAAPTAVPPAQPAFKIETPNKSSVKVGLLLQPQFQATQARFPAGAGPSGYSNDFFIRRTRILVGGSLFGVFEYFVDTDYPNLFLQNVPSSTTDNTMTPPVTTTTANALKNVPGMNIQDAFITWKAMGDMLKVDVGYMLPPLAHNAVQGATTLYSWDYFFNTFRSGNAFGTQPPAGGNINPPLAQSPVGRDAGLELRGLVAGGLIEYRAGLFQGLRQVATATDVRARNFFRTVGRLQVNLMDPETGFFYAGSYLGTKKILSVGASVDYQDTGSTTAYRYFAGDVLVDQPLGPAGVFTAQVNVAHWDGGTMPLVAIAKSTAVMGEVGFLIAAAHLSPIVRVEHTWITNANDDTYLGGGLAFWPYGHNSNLKAFYTNHKVQNAANGGSQFNVQWQLYFF